MERTEGSGGRSARPGRLDQLAAPLAAMYLAWFLAVDPLADNAKYQATQDSAGALFIFVQKP